MWESKKEKEKKKLTDQLAEGCQCFHGKDNYMKAQKFCSKQAYLFIQNLLQLADYYCWGKVH